MVSEILKCACGKLRRIFGVVFVLRLIDAEVNAINLERFSRWVPEVFLQRFFIG